MSKKENKVLNVLPQWRLADENVVIKGFTTR